MTFRRIYPYRSVLVVWLQRQGREVVLSKMMTRRVSTLQRLLPRLVLLKIKVLLDFLDRLIIRFGQFRLVLIAAADASRSGGTWGRGNRVSSSLLRPFDS